MFRPTCRARLAWLPILVLIPVGSASATNANYSNSWILPAYAAGQKPDLNIDGTLTPPIYTFFPPMAGWCLGKTAKLGLPLVHDLNQPAPTTVILLANEGLNGKVSGERVRICLSGYTATPPGLGTNVARVLNQTTAQSEEIQSLRRELKQAMDEVMNKIAVLDQKISDLQQSVSEALKRNAETEQRDISNASR